MDAQTTQYARPTHEAKLRRRVQRVDDLDHLAVATRTSETSTASQLVLRKIASSFLYFSAWSLTFYERARAPLQAQDEGDNEEVRFNQFYESKLGRRQKGGSIGTSFDAGECIEPYLDTLSHNQILVSIRNLYFSDFHGQWLDSCIKSYRDSKYMMNHPITQIPVGGIANGPSAWSMGHMAKWEAESRMRSNMEFAECDRRRLDAAFDRCQTLQQAIKLAAKRAFLDSETLSILRTKMEPLQTRFRRLCAEVEQPPRDLIASERIKWWDPEGTEPDDDELEVDRPEDTHAVNDFAANTAATLVFLVPTVSLMSCVPAALAWYRAVPAAGTARDADFYQLLSAILMQILGIATLLWPTMYHTRLARHSWIWTWVLAGVSICCSVVAVPLYLLVPVSWSALCSFGGSVTQALVTLQLVYAISAPGDRGSGKRAK